MLPTLLVFAAGLGLLYVGAEAVVRGASRLARSLGVSPLVIGLTVVAFGTSFPELFVSVLAALRAQSDVAIGNVVGSNIFNVAFILGASALARPLRIELRLVRLEIPIMIFVSLLFAGLVLDGRIGRADGGILLLGFGAYLAFVLRGAREAPPPVEAEFGAYESTSLAIRGLGRSAPSVGLILVGLAGLVLGARLLIDAALEIGRGLGVPDLLMGLTVVAAGTSLPELATSLLAGLKKEADIAVGNIVGSNIFNLLAILGVAALVQPLSGAPALVRFDLPAMILIAVLLLPLAWTGRSLSRWEGGLLLAAYLAYLGVLVAGALG